MPFNPAYGPYIAVYNVSVFSPPYNGDYFLAADSAAIYPPLNIGDTVHFLPYATLRPCIGRLERVCAIGASRVLFRVITDHGSFMFLCKKQACTLDLQTRLRNLLAPDKWLAMFDTSRAAPRIPLFKRERDLPFTPDVCCWSLMSSSREDWAQPIVM